MQSQMELCYMAILRYYNDNLQKYLYKKYKPCLIKNEIPNNRQCQIRKKRSDI